MKYDTAVHRWILRRVGLFVLLSLLGSAFSFAQITITRTSSPVFYLDSGASLVGMYAVYKIHNGSGTNYEDVWVDIGSFSGGVISLASNENGLYHLGVLNNGSTKHVFFYLQASGATASSGKGEIQTLRRKWRLGRSPRRPPIQGPLRAIPTMRSRLRTR